MTPAPDIPVYTTRGGVATTDAAGVYRIDGLPAGPIVIRAIVVPDTQTIVVGRVVDSNGNSVAGATVTTVSNLTATTGPTGTFSIANVPTTQGNIQVIARAMVNGQPWQGKSATVAPVPSGVTDVGAIVIKLLKVWDSGGDHVSWQNAANWNNDTLPSATDDVYIPITATVDLKTGTATINSLTSDGTLQISGGTLSLAAASVVNNAFTLNGSLIGSGSITITGATTVNGGTLSGSGRTVAKGGLLINSGLTLDGRTLDNAGAATWTDQYINPNNGAVFNNLPGSTFNLALSVGYSLRNTAGALGQFNNAVSLVKGGGASNSVSIPFTNTGVITVSAGTLDFSSGYVQTAGVTTLNGGAIKSSTPLQILGGKFTGAGAVIGNLANSGLVEPGNRVGALNVSGNYAQTGSGMLRMEISSTVPAGGFDQLNVTGAATLSGTLAISLTNGFQPSLGANFMVMTFGSHIGTFAQVNGLSIGNGTHFLVTYNNTSVVLQVLADTVTATSLDNSTMLTEPAVAQTAVLAPATPEAQPVVSMTNEAVLRLYLPLVINNAPEAAPDSDTVAPQSVRPAEPAGDAVADVLGYQLYLPTLMR